MVSRQASPSQQAVRKAKMRKNSIVVRIQASRLLMRRMVRMDRDGVPMTSYFFFGDRFTMEKG